MSATEGSSVSTFGGSGSSASSVSVPAVASGCRGCCSAFPFGDVFAFENDVAVINC